MDHSLPNWRDAAGIVEARDPPEEASEQRYHHRPADSIDRVDCRDEVECGREDEDALACPRDASPPSSPSRSGQVNRGEGREARDPCASPACSAEDGQWPLEVDGYGEGQGEGEGSDGSEQAAPSPAETSATTVSPLLSPPLSIFSPPDSRSLSCRGGGGGACTGCEDREERRDEGVGALTSEAESLRIGGSIDSPRQMSPLPSLHTRQSSQELSDHLDAMIEQMKGHKSVVGRDAVEDERDDAAWLSLALPDAVGNLLCSRWEWERREESSQQERDAPVALGGMDGKLPFSGGGGRPEKAAGTKEIPALMISKTSARQDVPTEVSTIDVPVHSPRKLSPRAVDGTEERDGPEKPPPSKPTASRSLTTDALAEMSGGCRTRSLPPEQFATPYVLPESPKDGVGFDRRWRDDDDAPVQRTVRAAGAETRRFLALISFDDDGGVDEAESDALTDASSHRSVMSAAF